MATSSGLFLATIYNQSQLAERKHAARYWSINTAATAVPLSAHPSSLVITTKLAAAILGGSLFGRGVLPAHQYCPCDSIGCMGENPMPHAHFTAVWDVKLLAWLHVLDIFRPCDLDLYPMTFIYELYPYCVEIHRKCKCELPTWNLSKAIVWQTDRQTYRIDRNYRPRRFAGGHSADA